MSASHIRRSSQGAHMHATHVRSFMHLTTIATSMLAWSSSAAPQASRASQGVGHVDPAYFSELRWRSIGPPRSGYVSAPAGVPGDATTYYAGMPEGGVWRTTNGGTTWKPIFDEARVAGVGAVAVAPSAPATVYVGTGDRSGWSFTPGNGVYKSTDGGKTWSGSGLRGSQCIAAIIVSPRDPNT